MITLHMLIGEINKVMIMRRITQARVAELSGLSKDAISKLLTGSRTSVNTDTLFAVMNALELHEDALMLAGNEHKERIIALFGAISCMPPAKREKALSILEDFILFCMEEK